MCLPQQNRVSGVLALMSRVLMNNRTCSSFIDRDTQNDIKTKIDTAKIEHLILYIFKFNIIAL